MMLVILSVILSLSKDEARHPSVTLSLSKGCLCAVGGSKGLSKDEARHPSVILSLSKDEARHPELVEGLPVEGGLKHVTLSLSKGCLPKED